MALSQDAVTLPEMLRGAEERAAGVYVVAPFKKPEDVIPLLDEAG